jgi:hypothetical protein
LGKDVKTRQPKLGGIIRRILALAIAFLIALAVTGVGWAARTEPTSLSEFTLDADAKAKLTDLWSEQLSTKAPADGWVPMRADLTDEMLDLMGLPSQAVLKNMRFPEPTIVDRQGRTERVQLPMGKGGGGGDRGKGDLGVGTTAALPAVTTYAGAGWFGIRPGAWILLLSGGGIGWCSAAHVYGSAGSYDISTAGHCGKTGDVATVIAAFGNRDSVAGPVLLDFGKFASSTGDAGIGKDWALIDIYSQYQNLVTPTMAFWGGPRGMYTKTGSLVSVRVLEGNRIKPGVTVTPDPFLAQAIVHYGHGAGIGAGGTPRAGGAIHWGASHFMFSGAISPGDSGSGANTLLGDTVGANMEAAGIITHIYIDALMRQGIGIMAGTRATQVRATLANGQIVPYPIPISGPP